MTAFTWPTGDSAFLLSGMRWGALHNGRSNASELNGATQGISLPGTRRLLTLDVPEQTYDERARLAAFFERLNGFEHRVAIWDLARPTPPGLAGSPTVSGAVSQFAETLNIASGGLAGVNMLKATQRLDAATWTKSATTISANATTAPDGTSTADKIVEDTATAQHLVFQSTTGSVSAGQAVTYSEYFKASGRDLVVLAFTSSGAFTSFRSALFDVTAGTATAVSGPGATSSIEAVGSGWYRCSLMAVADATGAVAARSYLSTTTISATAYLGNGTSGVFAWGAQVEPAESASPYSGLPTVNQGDWLGLVTSTGNQLVKAVNKVVADTSDLITGVEIRHMLRGSVANASAVTILRPTALYTQRNPDQVLMPRGGRNKCPAVSIDLVEAFA